MRLVALTNGLAYLDRAKKFYIIGSRMQGIGRHSNEEVRKMIKEVRVTLLTNKLEPFPLKALAGSQD
jgi:hypothetical protein